MKRRFTFGLLLAAFAALEWQLGKRQLGSGQLAAAPAPLSCPAPLGTLSPETEATEARLSFLVPAWNGRDDLTAFMAAYHGLSWSNKQLVLCVGGQDNGLDLARTFADPDVLVLEQNPGEGKQRALARCLAASDGEIIVLTDIDCLLDDAVITALIETLQRSGAAGVTGASRPPPEQLTNGLVRSHYATELVTLPRLVSPTDGLLGRAAALQRSVLESSCALDVPAPSGTDYTLAKELLKAGHTLLFVPGPQVQSIYPDTLKVYAHKQGRWLRNVVVLGQRYGAYQEVRAVQRTLAVPFVVLGCLLSGLVVWPLGLVGLLLLAHATLSRVRQQRGAGLKPSVSGSALHVLGDQWAAIIAVHDILRKRNTW